MPSEAEWIVRSARIRVDTDTKLMRFARDRKIMQTITTGITTGAEGGKKTLEIPNISEAINIILNEFFALEGY